jgi:hypothetical protein
MEHYPTFNYSTINGSPVSYGATPGIHHQHINPNNNNNAFNTSSYDPYATVYGRHHHQAAEIYARQTSASSLVDHTARVSYRNSFVIKNVGFCS